MIPLSCRMIGIDKSIDSNFTALSLPRHRRRHRRRRRRRLPCRLCNILFIFLYQL